MRILELPKNERPREKALLYGIEEISDVELLAIIIGVGVKNKSALEIAESLLKTYINLLYLSKAKVSSLKQEFGLSQITATRLMAIFEFYRRISSSRFKEIKVYKTALDFYSRYAYLGDETQEVLVVVMLNNNNHILKEKILYKGTSSFVELNLREIITELLQADTKKFVLIHNHPDGANKPSLEDIKATTLIHKWTKSLGLILFDHLILFKGGYFSFLDNNILR